MTFDKVRIHFQERREVFMRQLIPTNTMLGRIKLKIFGNSGVGKTTLVDSLKCGYFGSFFRKARLSSSNSVGLSKHKSMSVKFVIWPPYTRGPQVHMRCNWPLVVVSLSDMENGTTTPKHHSLPSQLSYEVVNGGYTKGIDVQQINISGKCELCNNWQA